MLEQGDPLVLIVLKIAVGRISVVFGGFLVVGLFLVEVSRLGLGEVPKENFEKGIMRLCASGIECGGGLTVIEVRECFQNVAVCVERPWLTYSTGGVSARVQDNLRVDEIPGGYSFAQSLAESRGGRHIRRLLGQTPLVVDGIYMMQQTRPFLVKASGPQHELKRIAWFGP